MNIKFSLPFDTAYGQKICIFGSIPELANFNSKQPIDMEYSNGVWICNLIVNRITNFEYAYILLDTNGESHYESGSYRKFTFIEDFNDYNIKDEWKPYTQESPFLSSAFKNVFFRAKSLVTQKAGNVIIKCVANNLSDNYTLSICGNNHFFGNWDQSKAQPMCKDKEGNWEIVFRSSVLKTDLEYKFLLLKKEDVNTDQIWENGDNRIISFKNISHSSLNIISHYSINLPSSKPKFAGTAVPVFSLKSCNSDGIGDFMDLKLFIDFLYSTNQNVLQILPINDTTMSHSWLDSYPYGSISIFAMHPIYLNTQKIGIVKDQEFMKKFESKTRKLNNLADIDYDAVLKHKWNYFTKIFEEIGEETLNCPEYLDFFAKNNKWLKDYAIFCFLRDKYRSADFRTWPQYSEYSKLDIESITSEKSGYHKKIAIHYFLQYHLHKQLTEVHLYANRKGIILKGDIPIGINKNSVEAWVEPQFFNFNGQAGAPPDDFSVRGQNWGFPTYNWEIMESDGFSWWKRRFEKMAEYFDAYRIDHILGFFRIWEIPISCVEGVMGHFNPALPMTADDMIQFGYNFNFERDCLPYVTDYMLDEYFGNEKASVIDQFLISKSWQTYAFKSDYNSQSKIVDFFSLNSNSNCFKFKEKLVSLLSEVLFVQDPIDPKKYHPRISSQYTKSYQDKSSDQKNCYNSIYNHFFYTRNNDFWYSSAMKKLPSLISSTGMLVCGEDLGMIPSCVASVMSSLSILSLEIQRMPKDPKSHFGNPYFYPYLSVCTTGTHDTSTLRAWWEEDHEESKVFFKTILLEDGIAPFYCEPWLCSKIIKMHLESPAMLTILPIQDWLSISVNMRIENPLKERINVPSNPKHYWRYRMHINIEDLLIDKILIDNIKNMIDKSGRGKTSN